MGTEAISIYSRIVIKGLEKDLGKAYVEDVDGFVDRNDDKVLDKKDKDGVVQTDEAWEYFLDKFNQAKYQSIMAELKRKGFEYPFDLTGPDGKDKRLVNWIDRTASDLKSRGVTDEVSLAKEFYSRIMPAGEGGTSKEHGGLNICFNDFLDESYRPMGEKLPLEVFLQRDKGKRFAICSEYTYFYVAILHHIGLEAYEVGYKEGDWRYLSSSENRNIWKTNEEQMIMVDTSHTYAYFISKDKKKYVALMGFERTRKAIDHYSNDREATVHHYSQEGGFYGVINRKYRLAEKRLKVALEIDPKNIWARYWLAKVYVAQNNFEKATKEINKAIEFNPHSADVYNRLGEIYYLQGNMEKAIVAYKESIRIKPNQTISHYWLGFVYSQQNKLNDAIVELKKVVCIIPRYTSARCYMVDCFIKQKMFREAEKEAKRAVKFDTNSGEAYYSLAKVCILNYSYKNNINTSMDALQKAVSLDHGLIEKAKTDAAFDRFKNFPRFKAIIKE